MGEHRHDKNWNFMVIRRYYYNGPYEAKILSRQDFRRENFPENRAQYRQEFYPCTSFEKAVKALDISYITRHRPKEPVLNGPAKILKPLKSSKPTNEKS